jgi:hypothetical protein
MDIYELLDCGKETIALRVCNDCNSGANYGHITLQVVHVLPNKGRYDDSLGFYDNNMGNKHQFKGLKIHCQMDKTNEQPYGWSMEINDIGSRGISLEKAEEIVKTLKPIQRKLNKISEQEGHELGFVEYVTRICRILKIKAFYGQYNGNLQLARCDTIGALPSYLRELIKENQTSLGFIKAA